VKQAPWHRNLCLFETVRSVGFSRNRHQASCRSHRLTVVPASIQKILNLNHDPVEDATHEASAQGLISTPILNEDGDPIWKVLVFDNLGRDVISSVLRVNDLRAWGVTIHLYARVLLPTQVSL
jgi:hypothetical protein